MNQYDAIFEKLPKFLVDELIIEYGEEITQKILLGFLEERVVSLRINTLKTTKENVINVLKNAQIMFEEVPWSPLALIIKNIKEKDLENLTIYENGEIYLQSLSSMLPPIILNPKQGYNILDMAAAPGGKTTQIAALTNNKCNITACEQNPIRAEKLKYNLKKQGVTCAYVLVNDARKLDDYFSFEQILLDAPCSGSGTIELLHPKSYESFSQKLVENSAIIQANLLNKALKILKPNQEMVYSTCSVLKLENEEVILKILKTNKAEIVPITFEGINHIPLLPSKIEGALSICPNSLYEGFFVVKIRKR